jgi:zinc-binding alcohol dehydrogenase/oxidoreductase
MPNYESLLINVASIILFIEQRDPMPSTMKALLLQESAEHKIKIEEVPVPKLGTGQVLVRMKAAALNHRDQWIREGKYARIRFGVILGSDGCGVVEAVENPADNHWLRKDVIINPSLDWGANPEVQSPRYHILGMPTNGTFAEYCAVHADRLAEKPAHLGCAEAAALPLAGLTAYRAVVRQCDITQGSTKTLLVTGIGGGVAQFAAQFATALGASVYATSGDDAKLERARTLLGLKGGANYRQADWHKHLLAEVGEFDAIIDSAAGNDVDTLLSLLKPGGTYTFFGATNGRPSSLNVHLVFWKQLRLQGSTMGNDEEFQAMVNLVNEKKILPVVDSVRTFSDIVAAFDSMQHGTQFGKLVVSFEER